MVTGEMTSPSFDAILSASPSLPRSAFYSTAPNTLRQGLSWPRAIVDEQRNIRFLLHMQYLMGTKIGLWVHGYEFNGKGGGHTFAGAQWRRDNCW
jgi:rhamnogalacturonyl hydrolase YesR